MTYEYAAYFKLLLLCGYQEELQQYINQALLEQDPISDIILSLSFAGNDKNIILSVLNEYLLQAKNTDIDYNQTVFDLVMSFLQKKYHDDSLSIESITQLMYHLALYTERYGEEPWLTMHCMDDLLGEANAGCIDKEDFLLKFEAFINNKTLLCSYSPVFPKENLFKRFLKKIRRKMIPGQILWHQECSKKGCNKMTRYLSNRLFDFDYHDAKLSFKHYENHTLCVTAKHLNIHKGIKENPYTFDMEIASAEVSFQNVQIESFELLPLYELDDSGNWSLKKMPPPRQCQQAEELLIAALKKGISINCIDVCSKNQRTFLELTASEGFVAVFSFDDVLICWDEYCQKAWYESSMMRL